MQTQTAEVVLASIAVGVFVLNWLCLFISRVSPESQFLPVNVIPRQSPAPGGVPRKLASIEYQLVDNTSSRTDGRGWM